MSKIRIKDLEKSSSQSIISTNGLGEPFYLSGDPGELSFLVYNLTQPMFLNFNTLAGNGIEFNSSQVRFELGGNLLKNTSIDLDGYNFTLINGNNVTFNSNKFVLNLANQFTLDTLTSVINSTISISFDSPTYYFYPFTNSTADTGFIGKVFFTDNNSKLKYGTITTENIAEFVNLYYTDTRARSSISAGAGLSYDALTGVISLSVSGSFINNQNVVTQNANFIINGIGIGGAFKNLSKTDLFLPNNLTITERDLILSPENGNIIFNTDLNILQVYNGAWSNLSTISGNFTDENPSITGLRDGTNMNFYLSNNYAPNSIQLYLNGVRLQKIIDYTEMGTNLITLKYPPKIGDVFLADYIKI